MGGRAALTGLVLLASGLSAEAGQIVGLPGKIYAVDGDTLAIGAYVIQLDGIDAPESDQLCLTGDDQAWECGQAAFLALQDLLAGREVRCDVVSQDGGQRSAGVCWVTSFEDPGPLNVNAEMVRAGLAVAAAEDGTYMLEEEEARGASKGLWSGEFITPAEWRSLYAHASDTPAETTGASQASQ